jgi:NDP-sugar pyrophosphorylase family protein
LTKPRLRALVLAAGRGERLRPLTDSVPKPLLPLAGQAVAAHTLERLCRAGCEATALNLHHLGDQIRAHFGDDFEGMTLAYSPEAALQGTLGALYPLREFLAEAQAVVLVNGDSHCRWPIEALVRRHLRESADATLLVAERAGADEPRGLTLDRAGRVVGFRGSVPASAAPGEWSQRVFAGAHVLTPALLERVPEGPGDIIAGLYQPLLDGGGRIATLSTRRRWHDLGKPRRYLAAALDSGLGWPAGRSRVAAGAIVERGARLRHSVVERGARVAAGARLVRSLVLPGAVVGSGCRLHEVIVGFGAVLPNGTAVERRLVTPLGKEAAPPAATVVGQLVFTLLDG